MIVKQYIKDFEKLGFGMFVHFGLYSLIEKGEWVKHIHKVPDKEYEALADSFDPKPDWAKELAATAKNAGCKYITLTTRHHDGFSLYDVRGLNSYDAVHAGCGRDLVREFVDACREQGLIPFFYHTLLDWYVKDFTENFSEYLKYLRKSIEILCTNYGKIGGFWFDGAWSKEGDVWEEDELYAVIRKYQPEAMIINNTGLSAQGALGHMELDSVTFERGKPRPINMEGAPKYVASEMCEVFGDHWGYASNDLNFKSSAQMIKELAECRRYGCNMLMNVGPMPDGTIRPIEAALLGLMGEWVHYFDEAIRSPRPTDIVIEGKPEDFVLQDGNSYYVFCSDLPMIGDPNVAKFGNTDFEERFTIPQKIRSIHWLDDGTEVAFQQDGDRVNMQCVPFFYGTSLIIRVAKIECEL